MADIVQSLFGLTPEAYQQRQAAQADRMALEYAQLTPMQQAQFAIGRGAYQLAGALGGALGGQDPELQRISARNAIAQQIDYTNPQSMMAGVQALSQAGDTVGAMQLADILRKTESEMALRGQRMASAQASLAQATRERVQQTPAEIAKAREIGRLTTALQTPGLSDLERMDLEAQLASLRPEPKEAKEPTTQELTNARAIALRAGPVGSPEFNAAFDAEYKRLTTKTSASDRFGVEREAEAMAEFRKPFGELTQEQQRLVNEAVTRKQTRVAAAGAPQFPGQKAFADIPAFRAKVQGTIATQLKAIDSSDQALQAINDSLATNNFAAYKAAQVQFARAIAGAGDLSQKELKAAGADPSLLGGAADVISTLFTSTPTADTQKQIRNTLNAIRTVAAKQAQTEIDQQRRIALRSPGYDASAVNEALDFPQLRQQPTAGPQSLAEQARAELEKRKQGGR